MDPVNEDDLEKLDFYLNATFDFFESILFSSIITKPEKKYLSDLKKEMSRYKIEKLYNHIHLTAITTDPKKQREFAFKIWMNWRLYFEKFEKFKNVIIEIEDVGLDVILYAYENKHNPSCHPS